MKIIKYKGGELTLKILKQISTKSGWQFNFQTKEGSALEFNYSLNPKIIFIRSVNSLPKKVK